MSNPWTSRPHTSSWRSLGMSFLTHLLLAFFLILFAFSPSPKGTDGELRRAGIVLAVTNDQAETEFWDENDAVELESEQVAEQANQPTESLPPPPLAVDTPNNQQLDLPGVEALESVNTDVNSMVDIDSDARLESARELTADDLKLIKADQRLLAARAPKGEPTTIRVFGSGGLHGRSFVFVLDRSKSMGSGGLGVIKAARNELSNAIGQLKPNHQFQIIGYHERTVAMTHRRLLSANETNQKAVAPFIGNLGAFGSTNHENGLIAAAAFKPDIIVLLTDGGYPELNESQLKGLKKYLRNSQVHCIQFGLGSNQQSNNFMRKLAAQQNGTYRYIDVSKWKKNP